ncbi:glycoside hydrolase family 3 protein [Marispirochaeta sp.]|jgi:beta-N-acetylhexosaminidase|uniref:glycoside hydrolase family 3 protein n=1 Tax=Marispirochaeta sp. TaxID=2038653 RepID=UPI0029C9973C|nr:glycoside hydrolase family 3 protein [Marispirochaeta sp.]
MRIPLKFSIHNKLRKLLMMPFLLAALHHGAGAETFIWSNRDLAASQAFSMASSMSEEELLGQVFMIGFRGPGADPEILSWIREKHIGGVKVFGWNGEDLEALAGAAGTMQQTAVESGQGIPLFIATDQEGGWVRHVKGRTSITPGNMGIAAGGLPYDAYTTGKLIGAELRALGINMNFAPTVDVYVNPEAHVIGPRAFSSDPVTVGVMSQAFYHGMRSEGIISTAKHFPGHGNADQDSHGFLPIINDDLDTVMERDLLPYQMLIPEGLPAIMTGHLAFPAITGDTTPASLSEKLIRDLLRKRLGFQGIVITDDLRMNGAQYGGESIPQAAEAALRAGNDMIMISLDSRLHQQVWNHLSRVLKNDPAFKDILLKAATRILSVKEEYLNRPWSVPLKPDISSLRQAIPADSDYLFQQACRALTSISAVGLPLDSSDRILLAGQLGGFFREGQKRFPNADVFDFSYNPFYSAPPGAAAGILRRAEKYDRIVFLLATPGSTEVLKEIVRKSAGLKERLVIISVLTPVYLFEMDWIRTALAAYGTGDESFAAAFAALAGDFIPHGKLPVSELTFTE